MHVIFTSEPNVGAVIGVTLFTLLIPLAVYVWVALALGAVFRKTGEPAWKAWVPILNSWTLLELGGQAGWWAVLALLPIVNVVAVVFTIIAIHAINGRFGLGGGYTVLGALVFPVWASVVGWGSARPLTGLGGIESTGYEPRPAPPAWQPPAPGPAAPPVFAAAPPPPPAFPAAPPSPPAPPAFAPAPPPPPPSFAPEPPAPPAFSPAPPAPPVPPATAAAPAYAPAPAFAPPPAPPAPAVPPPPPPASVAPPPPPATEQSPVAAAGAWAPPAAATPTAAEPTTAMPVVPAPAPEPAVDEDDERTVITQKRRREHRLVLPTGTEVTLTGDTVLLGRAPVAVAATATAQIVPVSDDTKTISKTHAVLRRTAEGWSIEDLGSTNGTALVQDDAEIELVGIQPLTERFFLGDAELRIVEA